MRTRVHVLLLAATVIFAACEIEHPVRGSDPHGPADQSLPSSLPAVLRESRPLAGTTFAIEVIGRDAAIVRRAMDAAFAEVARLENVVSEWRDDSEISAVNNTAGTGAVALSAELFGVINRAIWFAQLTGGAFDPSFAGCAQLWSIPKKRIPAQAELAHCRRLTGYQSMRLDTGTSSITFGKPGMRIGLGGIGKGYRVDRAAEILESFGLNSYVVNGGGDIRVSAGELHGPWAVEIAHPREPDRRLGKIQLRRGAIATSGDSSWYFDQGGVRYHHIFDPRTGEPARASVAVTVIAERAIDADALATGLFVLGPERSLVLLERLPGYEALLVREDLTTHQSPGFPLYLEAGEGEYQ
jgi:thiamine biosynthesis lipoprotein